MEATNVERAGTELDRTLIASNLELPCYVRDGVERHMDANPGQTFRSVVLAGFQALGIEIEDRDLTPERRRRRARVRAGVEGVGEEAANTPVATSFRIPRYVRARAEAYLLRHPDMRFRHLVMAGFRELGIQVEARDMVAERRNVSGLSLSGQ